MRVLIRCSEAVFDAPSTFNQRQVDLKDGIRGHIWPARNTSLSRSWWALTDLAIEDDES